MRNINPYLICLLLLICRFTLYSQNKYNLDFNNFDSENQELPEGWTNWSEFKNVEVTAEKIEAGNTIGKVISKNKKKYGCIAYTIPANYEGDTIVLTGKMKFEDVKTSVGLLLRIDDEKHNVLEFENMERFKINGTKDWEEYKVKLPYPKGAENIYVGGLLNGKGVAWFDDFKIEIDGKNIQTLKEIPKITLDSSDVVKLDAAIENASSSIDLSTNESLEASLNSLISEVGDKRIVAIGESTHGTSEFYKLREIITKRLIQDKGYNMVVLESPYDNIELLNKDLDSEPLADLITKHLYSIYHTEEMKSFLEWYKDNRFKYTIRFIGNDDSTWRFYELLEANLDGIKDAQLDKLMKKLKSNLTKINKVNAKKKFELGIVIYNDIETIEKHLEAKNELTNTIEETLFNGKSTYVNYVNLKNNNPFQSRDEIMAKRISYLAKNKDNKIIVWAHNAHISNEIIVDNEIGIMGRDLKQEFGVDYHSIGLTTLKGSYSYIDNKFINGDPNFSDKLNKASIQSTNLHLWENVFSNNGDAFYLDITTLINDLKTDDILGYTKLFGYGKETKQDIYKVPLLKYFDTLIFIEQTNATTPLFN